MSPFKKIRPDLDIHVGHYFRPLNNEVYDSHYSFEIYLPISKGIQVYVENKLFNAEKNDLFLFNNMEIHKIAPPQNQPYERFVMHINPEYISELSSKNTDLMACFVNRAVDSHCYLRLSDNEFDMLVLLIEKVIFHINTPEYGSDLYLKILLVEILLHINSYFRSKSIVQPTNNQEFYQKIKPVIDYIHNHLDEDLSLGQIAKMFYISKSHLCSMFKKTTSFSISEYIIVRRIAKAKELLKTRTPVSQVCMKVGFGNESHFIRTFKKVVGMSPKQYAHKG